MVAHTFIFFNMYPLFFSSEDELVNRLKILKSGRKNNFTSMLGPLCSLCCPSDLAMYTQCDLDFLWEHLLRKSKRALHYNIKAAKTLATSFISVGVTLVQLGGSIHRAEQSRMETKVASGFSRQFVCHYSICPLLHQQQGQKHLAM